MLKLNDYVCNNQRTTKNMNYSNNENNLKI